MSKWDKLMEKFAAGFFIVAVVFLLPVSLLSTGIWFLFFRTTWLWFQAQVLWSIFFACSVWLIIAFPFCMRKSKG